MQLKYDYLFLIDLPSLTWSVRDAWAAQHTRDHTKASIRNDGGVPFQKRRCVAGD